MAAPIEIFQTKVTTAADALALINGVFQWAFGPTPPSITFPFLNWANTGTNSWYQRNADDNAWIFKGSLDAAFAPMDGWITGLTAVYVSPTSIKIEGLDVTDRIQQGTKIRYKQGSGYKYDFVSSVAFSTDTTLTLLGGSTVTNEPITDFWFSNIANPIGWPFGVDYIEGANANGTWRKWADGTLECWGTKTFTSVVISDLWGGSIYTSPQESVTWPISFTVIESANINVLARTPIQFAPALIDYATSHQGKFYFWRTASITFDSITAGFYAKGRWK